MTRYEGGTATINVTNNKKQVVEIRVVDCYTLQRAREELKRRWPGSSVKVRKNRDGRDFWA